MNSQVQELKNEGISVGVTGCQGRMGRMIMREIIKSKNLCLAGGTISTMKSDLQSLGEIAGLEATQDRPVVDVQELFKVSNVVIDFTKPKALERHLAAARTEKKALVIGTTGLTKNQFQLIEQTAQQVPIIYASNTSMGITVINVLLRQAAKLLGGEDFDLEISECHHREKEDVPSGTSLTFGKTCAQARGLSEKESFLPLDRVGKRPQGPIGFSVSRGGTKTCEHRISFYGEDEVVELTHRAFSRALFAKGAVRAAQWLVHQKPGLYTMEDVLLVK